MKHFLQITLLACSIIFITSCSSDDPEPTHEMGTWVLENFVVTELPSSFSNSEGTIRSINYYGFESYKIELNQDNTFLTSIKILGRPTSTIEGSWELTETKIKFITNADTDDEVTTEFGIIRNESNQLWYSESIDPNNNFDIFISDAKQAQLIEDHGSGTAANEYLATLAQSEDQADIDELEGYFSTPSFDLVYTFIKSE